LKSLVFNGVDEDSEDKVCVRVLHRITFHHNLIFLFGLLPWLYHAYFFSLCALINILSQIETAHTNHVSAAV
jgi:hypothetical protein